MERREQARRHRRTEQATIRAAGGHAVRRRVLTLLSVGSLSFAIMAIPASPASADAPEAQAWWSKTNNSALPVGLPAPPNAPADGLYVASDSTGISAFGAVRFTVPDGATTGPLTLKVGPNGLGTPVVGLCRTTASWRPIQNGPFDKAPAFDDKACTNGAISADGTSITFPTSSLVNAGLLDVAVVPLKDASGNQPTFQLPIQKPDTSALTVTAASPSSSSDSFSSPSPASSVGSTASSPASSPSSSASSGAGAGAATRSPSGASSGGSVTPSSSSSGPLSSAAPASVDGGAALSSSPPQGPALAPSNARRLVTRPIAVSDDTTKYRTIGILGLIALAIVYTVMNERPGRVPRALVAFGGIGGDDNDSGEGAA